MKVPRSTLASVALNTLIGLASLGAIGFALPLPLLGLAIWAHVTRATRDWIEA